MHNICIDFSRYPKLNFFNDCEFLCVVMGKVSSWFALSLTTFIGIRMKNLGRSILNVCS
jgi:hypothetical protein